MEHKSINIYWLLVHRSLSEFAHGSVLGVLWSIIIPLIQGVVLLIVFSTLLGRPIEKFLFYMWPALFSWQFFVKTSMDCSRGLSRPHLRFSNIPNIVFTLSKLFDSVPSYLCIIIIISIARVVYASHFPFIFICQLIPAFILLLLFTMGVGLLLATAYIFLPDTVYLWNIVTQTGVFLCPIYFPEEILVQSQYWWIMKFNPMFYMLSLIREPLLTNHFSSLSLWFICSTISFGTALTGIYLYQKLNKYFINFL